MDFSARRLRFGETLIRLPHTHFEYNRTTFAHDRRAVARGAQLGPGGLMVCEPRSQSDTGKDRDRTEDPKVVSGSLEAKHLSQDLTPS